MCSSASRPVKHGCRNGLSPSRSSCSRRRSSPSAVTKATISTGNANSSRKATPPASAPPRTCSSPCSTASWKRISATSSKPAPRPRTFHCMWTTPRAKSPSTSSSTPPPDQPPRQPVRGFLLWPCRSARAHAPRHALRRRARKAQDIQDAQNHLAKNALRLVTRLSELLQHCQFVLQQQTDQRLRQLTVLSAIFMPLTITGVYGMNFRLYAKRAGDTAIMQRWRAWSGSPFSAMDYPQTERLVPVRPAGGIRPRAASA